MIKHSHALMVATATILVGFAFSLAFVHPYGVDEHKIFMGAVTDCTLVALVLNGAAHVATAIKEYTNDQKD